MNSQEPFKILIYTPFKVGSTNLSGILQLNYNFIENWQHDGDEYIQSSYQLSKNFILRGHTLPLTSLLDKKQLTFNAWITLIRPPYELYPASYFQDIDTPGCPYYLGQRKVIDSTPQELVNHFLSFDWGDIRCASFDYNFGQIQQYTGVNLWKERFDKESGFSIYKSQSSNFKQVGVFRIDKMNDIHALLIFFEKLNIPLHRKSLMIRPLNRSQNKWYHSQYKNLLSHLPQSYYDQYKAINNQVYNQFY